MSIRSTMRGVLIAAFLGTLLLWAVRPRLRQDDRTISGALAKATLVDPERRSVPLRKLLGRRATVLVFTGIDCPLGNLYMPRLEELAQSYRERGVVFLGINSNPTESIEQVQANAREFHATFPVLKDPGNLVADLTQVQRTCEALVIDPDLNLRYRGAIDDQYAASKHRDQPTRHYLRDALDQMLAGQAVMVAFTAVVGCPIQRVDPPVGRTRLNTRPPRREIVSASESSEPPVQVGPVTYSGDVAAILQRRCQTCHRPGQVGRFSLVTYEQARRWSRSISEVVEDRRMPPWHADPRFGRFENDRSLSARERDVILAWVEQGSPLGDAKVIPTRAILPQEWNIGEPDNIFSMVDAFEVPARGAVNYQHFRVPTGFTEDRWVQAAEIRPGDAAVVHHINVYVEAHDRNKRDTAHVNPQLAFYAPGDMPVVYAPGTAKRVAAHSVLDIVVHYTPIGTPRVDRSSIALIFARQPVTREATTIAISRRDFVLPAGAKNHEVRSQHTFSREAYLVSMMPHMHLRGKDFRYTISFPDAGSETLLSVPAYDFAWQTLYRLAEPIRMPQGTRLECLAHFDNSSSNPANPDPTKAVTWGDQTWDEMMIGFTDYAVDLPVPALADRSAEGIAVDSRR